MTAIVWIPAFAGMTGVEGGNDGVEVEGGNNVQKIGVVSAIIVHSSLTPARSNH